MNHFLRKASFSSTRNSIIGIIAIGTAGSGIRYWNANLDLTVKLSIPALLCEHLSFQGRPLFVSSDHWQLGSFPLFLLRVDSAPAGDITKEPPLAVGDGAKPSCGCLGRDSIANAAAKVAPAVVNLSVPRDFYGLSNGKSMSSGTIIDADGTILTCAHAVVDYKGRRVTSKGKVDVTLQDGRTFEGTVVNADLHSDIAIVKIKSKTPLPAAKLGSSSKLRPGDWVIALGCPLSLQNTVTAGIVSCVDRKNSDLGIGGMHREYLQTDCAINAGNSGGPLVNVDGEIIGVNIMKVLTAHGLSFSVPIDSVSKIIEHFKKSGRVVRPWLGLKMLDLNEMIIAQLKERDARFPEVEKGILVPMVTPGSPADRAGFHPGDVVIEFDGKPVQSIKEVRRGADQAEIYSLAFSSTAQWLAVSSDKGTVHVFSLKVDSVALGDDRSSSASKSPLSLQSALSSLSILKGVLPKYFSSEWSVAQFRLPEGSRYIVAFGQQMNTIMIIGMDGSFHRCQFDPVNGGQMTQIEEYNFLKPEETFSRSE